MRMTEFCLAGSAAILLGISSRSEAGMPVIFGAGEHISHVLDVSDASGMVHVGYKYSYGSLFWIPVATWDGKFVCYEGDRYGELTDEQLAELERRHGPLSAKVSLWVRFGNYLSGAILVSLLVVPSLVTRHRRKRDARNLAGQVNDLLEQPKYRQARDIYLRELDKGGEAFKKAVAHLTTHGVPPDKAQQDMHLLVGVLMAQAQAEEGKTSER